MSITVEQIEKLLPEMVKKANPADHIEVLDRSLPIPPQKVELGVAVHALRHNRYDADTLRSLIEAFPAHTFLRALTVEDLPALARALHEAYERDIAKYR